MAGSRGRGRPRKRSRGDGDQGEGTATASAITTSNGASDNGTRQADPFYFALKCETMNDPMVLWWHSPAVRVPLRVEESMIDVLVKWQRTERGMMKDQPKFRLDQVHKLCQSTGVPIRTALSLRRHHMKRLNPSSRMNALRLGKEDDVRESARLFEEAVETFLKDQQVLYWTEDEHKEHIRKNRKNGDPYPPTPDFILREQVLVKRFTRQGGSQRQTVEERKVCWVEAKMFYGASTIDHDNKSAVGNLLATARKYKRVYGEGAMVFMHGCGDRLASQLAAIGVIALDCSGAVVLDTVHAHQRTWCGDKQGNILP